jgi:hypothetical protein
MRFITLLLRSRLRPIRPKMNGDRDNPVARRMAIPVSLERVGFFLSQAAVPA